LARREELGKNWGRLSIDASSTPADLTYPTVLKLPNEVRGETTELIIDEHCEHSSVVSPLTSLGNFRTVG